ncbi:hypothetical protein NQ317_001716 [Molorchus minor]|uniref:Uncharacterized protein n=1 Tax=Molorchus minor TaxID=1323400 RepID=A0ABQ9IXJ0_9CUCU|nr:hypothetical protein NQ317_001716 [Molorchus minor]
MALVSTLRRFRVKLNERTRLPLKMDVDTFLPSPDGGIWLDFEKFYTQIAGGQKPFLKKIFHKCCLTILVI